MERRFVGIILFLLSVFIFSNYVFASITYQSGSTCTGGNVCLLSALSNTNSHAGACGNYTSYVICSDEVTSANIRNSICSAGENGVLSLYQLNNTHVGTYRTYDYNLCVSPSNYDCVVKASSCSAGQTCMASAYSSTNTHIGDCDYYSNKICCGVDSTAPTISSPSLTPTKLLPGETVTFTVTVTDDFTVDTVLSQVTYPNGTSRNFTMQSAGGNSYSLTFIDTEWNGVHTWSKVYANDSVNNVATSFPGLQFRVLGVTYVINGKAFDSLTGATIQSGNVTAIVKETGDGVNATFSNGTYSVNLRTSLLTNETSFNVGIIVSGGGKSGYSEVYFGGGSLTSLTQSCATKLWHFNGTAIDPMTGAQIIVGNVGVNVKNSVGNIFSNSTTFSNGVWDIYLMPCLVPGYVSTFEFVVSNNTRVGYFSVRQVAK